MDQEILMIEPYGSYKRSKVIIHQIAEMARKAGLEQPLPRPLSWDDAVSAQKKT